MSQAEENYLKAIFALQSEFGKGVSTNLIAKKIATKPSSVTDMLKKLATKNLIIYKKYQGVYLTKEGDTLAKKVIRKHRLWETFLVNTLGFSWHEVHDIAEQLEHVKSVKLIDKLDTFLEYPKYDPHGDFIPDKKGNLPQAQHVFLANIPLNSSCVLRGVKDSSDVFLNYLNQKNISLGSLIKVEHIESFDKSIQIKVNSTLVNISQKTADNLIVSKQ
jgi:DtxR family transcriptional regulator, Mn-dependent transcriptional regulator